MATRNYLRLDNIVQFIKDNVTEPITHIRMCAHNSKFTQYYEYDITNVAACDKLTKDYNHLSDLGYRFDFLPLD